MTETCRAVPRRADAADSTTASDKARPLQPHTHIVQHMKGHEILGMPWSTMGLFDKFGLL